MLCSSARLFIYWENAPTKPSLAYFSKIVFAYKVGLFFSKIFFFESALASENCFVFKVSS